MKEKVHFPAMDAVADLSVQAEEQVPQSVTIFGSTGTIGRQTLDVMERHKGRFKAVALTAQENVALLAEQARRHDAALAVIGDESKFAELKAALGGTNVQVAAGAEAIVEAALHRADCYMAAIVGVAGLRPAFEAAKQGTRVALANKECLVSAGSVFLRQISAAKTTLLPVDSEHCAVFQALAGAGRDDISRITLTASGGPFRTWSKEQLARARPDEALRHPTWSMGRKITIDSATLMNKGLELIEAYHLFPVGADQLGVIVHPQSLVHCLVEFADGSVIAQMSVPDMRGPIAYSLSWPKRISTPARRLSVEDLGRMSFEEPDEGRFPALRIARQVLNEGGAAGTIFNAANEVAVEAFLSGEIGFMSIAALVERTLEAALSKIGGDEAETIDQVIDIDQAARGLARSLLGTC